MKQPLNNDQYPSGVPAPQASYEPFRRFPKDFYAMVSFWTSNAVFEWLNNHNVPEEVCFLAGSISVLEGMAVMAEFDQLTPEIEQEFHAALPMQIDAILKTGYEIAGFYNKREALNFTYQGEKAALEGNG